MFLTNAVFFNILGSFAIKEELDGFEEFGAFSICELCSQAVEDGVHVLSNKPSCPVMVLLVGIVPDQCTFEHCYSSVRVNSKNCHMRVSNNAEELLPCTFHGHLGLDAFVNIGASSCHTL